MRKPSEPQLFATPQKPRQPVPPAAMAVGAYCKAWQEVRVGRPAKSITGQVARQAKALIGEGVPASIVIEAASLIGRKGYGAIGLVKMVGQLQQSRADVDAAQARARLIQEQGF